MCRFKNNMRLANYVLNVFQFNQFAWITKLK